LDDPADCVGGSEAVEFHLSLLVETNVPALVAATDKSRQRDTLPGYGKLRAMAQNTTPTRGYTATKDQLQARLKRIEGQVRRVQGMVDEDRYCIDVLTQISAIQAALDKVALGLLDDHARHCVVGGAAGGTPEECTSEMMAAVGRLLHRG
jgi:CsoR family transcriptional regulator, copper-sensing transcriptional repressor